MVGSADMFKQRSRKSRKTILSLIEAAQTEHEESEETQTMFKAVKKTGKKENKFRIESISPRGKLCGVV